ncbi:MAG: cytochrome c oxidase subunit 3 family protein [Armatimonadetes bacterium]|nr:cytochrome c oxidase subunit 3 family protein [Armatimonadota bacterium]
MSVTERELELGHQFEDLEQQTEAYTVGMWVFLVTEVLFFGALFMAYIVYRSMYPQDFFAASGELDIALGGLNTAILITSSLTMALAVRSAMLDRWKAQIGYILATMGFAFAFLVIKYFEYSSKFEHHLFPGEHFDFKGENGEHAEMFFSLYFAMTGLHGIHVLVGILIMVALVYRTWRMRAQRQDYIPIELTGLYWHFVDIVWIFLYPLLYLIGPLGSGKG